MEDQVQIESNTESTRKLVSVQVIDSLFPIAGADKIEGGKVLGYTVVVPKGQFKAGDKCVFFEVDSILPFAPWSDFLRDKTNPDKRIRLKTIRLKGQVSQGLALRLSDFNFEKELAVGDDLTDILKVEKYEIILPAQLRGQIAGCFPSFLSKSDQKNIQSNPDVVNEVCGKSVFATLKYDGTSVTYFTEQDGTNALGVCSRNWKVKPDDTVYWDMVAKYDIAAKMKEIEPWYALQGEIVGPGVQKNRLGLKDVQFFIYDIFDIRTHRYVAYDEYKAIVAKLQLQSVPEVFVGVNPWSTVDEFLDFADKQYYSEGLPAEGVVVKTLDPVYSEVLKERLSFKALSRVFKLKYPEA